MRDVAEEFGPEVSEGFDIGFADFAQEQAFMTGHTLTIVEAEIGIDIGLVLEVANDDAGTVVEGEGVFGRSPFVGEMAEDFPAVVLEIFDVGFADFAKEQDFEVGETLAIIDADLSEHPIRFAAAASAAVADKAGAGG